ncbi:hypothetical protein ACLI4Z_06880 [Natrialbaceae archaeon A-arb3/5]
MVEFDTNVDWFVGLNRIERFAVNSVLNLFTLFGSDIFDIGCAKGERHRIGFTGVNREVVNDVDLVAVIPVKGASGCVVSDGLVFSVCITIVRDGHVNINFVTVVVCQTFWFDFFNGEVRFSYRFLNVDGRDRGIEGIACCVFFGVNVHVDCCRLIRVVCLSGVHSDSNRVVAIRFDVEDNLAIAYLWTTFYRPIYWIYTINVNKVSAFVVKRNAYFCCILRVNVIKCE